MKNLFQAKNPGRRPDRALGKTLTRRDQREVREVRQFAKGINPFEVYPEVPATWPNRAVRRAVKGNRPSRIPGPWAEFLRLNPKVLVAIKAL